MKQKKSKAWMFAVCVIMLLASCTSHRELVFANREWQISNYYGQIIDRDTTYRMTFGNVLIPDPLPIISSVDSVSKYPGLDHFIADILHTSHLDNAEILFYAPHMHTMFVKPSGNVPPMRPSSVSCQMDENLPYTMWVYEDDIENWTRKNSEMYTYIYYDKSKRQLLIVDHYDYGDTPIAQINILQSPNKSTSKMNVHPNLYLVWSEKRDLRNFTNTQYIEYWAHQVDSRRKRAFDNYKIGQEQAKRKFNSQQTVVQADSALFAGDPITALKHYRKYLKYEMHPETTVIYNAACAASLSGEIDLGISLLENIAKSDSTWYYKEPLDKDLSNLQKSEEWESFDKMIAKRRFNAEKNYDVPLRQRLTQIRRKDQDVRHRFLAAYNAPQQDSLLINTLLEEMKRNDSENLIEVQNIIDEYGWPGKDKVGDECVTIWMVLQHSDIESQTKALPMLKMAASKGDISPASIAMLEDRILVNSGKKQIYGTQVYYSEDDGKKKIIFPIEDAENVDKRRNSVGLPPLKDEYSDEEIETIR